MRVFLLLLCNCVCFFTLLLPLRFCIYNILITLSEKTKFQICWLLFMFLWQCFCVPFCTAIGCILRVSVFVRVSVLVCVSLCLCACVCAYVRVSELVCVCLCLCACVCLCACICAWVSLCLYAYVCDYVRVSVLVCVSLCLCACVFACVCACTRESVLVWARVCVPVLSLQRWSSQAFLYSVQRKMRLPTWITN